MRLQEGRVGKDDGAIDGVFELADVAGPVEGGEQGQGLARTAGDALAFLDIEAGDEVVDQGRDVLAALAQGRSLDREDVEAIEQILAEGAGPDLLGRVAVGGRDDTDVNLDRAFGADGVNLALLQGAQQFDLHVQRQFADLVEEQGAAVGFLEFAEVFVVGAGEGPLFMAEQDRLDQVGGQGAAVDGHEGLARAVRGAVQGTGDDFLADAAFACDQDRDGRLCGTGAQ